MQTKFKIKKNQRLWMNIIGCGLIDGFCEGSEDEDDYVYVTQSNTFKINSRKNQFSIALGIQRVFHYKFVLEILPTN